MTAETSVVGVCIETSQLRSLGTADIACGPPRCYQHLQQDIEFVTFTITKRTFHMIEKKRR